MVKKIKFALEMKDGVKVRTLEELQDNFDLKTVIGYFLDGKLQKWLEDRYYDEKVEALQQLDTEQPDIRAICNILEVPYAETVELDIDSIQKQDVISTQSLIAKKQGSAYHKGHSAYKVSQIFDFMLSNQRRRQSEKLFRHIIEGLQNYQFDPDAKSRKMLEIIQSSGLNGYFRIF